MTDLTTSAEEGGAIEVVARRGWEIVRLRTSLATVDIVPEKGGDIISLRWLPLDLEVLWESPLGLPQRAAAARRDDDSEAAFLRQYPGGWQTLFPNAGNAVTVDGSEWGFHGEAALIPWTWSALDGAAIEMSARLQRAPFVINRVVRLVAGRLEVEESIISTAAEPVEVMWGHHPAFGAPFLDATCRITAAARTFVADDERDTPTGDLLVGARSVWPSAPARGGGEIDLAAVPGDGRPRDRLGYLLDFERGHVSVHNPALALSVDLDWDASVFPCAWYWLEARAGTGFPWYGRAYVLALEPQSSYPAQGLHAARTKNGSTLTIAPGETRSVVVACTLRPAQRAD